MDEIGLLLQPNAENIIDRQSGILLHVLCQRRFSFKASMSLSKISRDFHVKQDVASCFTESAFKDPFPQTSLSETAIVEEDNDMALATSSHASYYHPSVEP